MTNSSKDYPTPPKPLEYMKERLRQSIQDSGSDSLSSRMLKAEIARFERELKEGHQTQAEQWISQTLK